MKPCLWISQLLVGHLVTVMHSKSPLVSAGVSNVMADRPWIYRKHVLSGNAEHPTVLQNHDPVRDYFAGIKATVPPA